MLLPRIDDGVVLQLGSKDVGLNMQYSHSEADSESRSTTYPLVLRPPLHRIPMQVDGRLWNRKDQRYSETQPTVPVAASFELF